jgi:hypothetical protein
MSTYIVAILLDMEDSISLHKVEARSWRYALIDVIDSISKELGGDDAWPEEAKTFVMGVATEDMSASAIQCQVTEGWWFNVTQLEELL